MGAHKTTKIWEFLVHWKDDSSSWIKLKDLKVSNPIKFAGYDKATNIENKPSFIWWIPYIIHKSDRKFQKVKSKYWRTAHMFGKRAPKNVDEA
jgi:hypothetical protein